MKGKAEAKGDFGATSIRDLPPDLRDDPDARAAVAARKRVVQARYVAEKEEAALAARQERLEAAKAELEEAEAALAELGG